MIIDLAQLKSDFLRDLPLADQFGRPMSDTVLTSKLKAAVAAFQRKYGVRLEPTIVKMGELPLSADKLYPDLPRYHADTRPYDPRSFEGNRFVSLHLPVGPVKEVLSVGLSLPGQLEPLEFGEEWVQVQPRSRVLQIYPKGPMMRLMPLATNGFGLGAMFGGKAIPAAWQIIYKAGYTAEDLQGEYIDVLNALGMIAAIGILIPGSMDKFAARGIAGLSASVDGLSNSTQMAGGGQTLRFGALIDAYRQELQEWEKAFQDRGVGRAMGVV